MGRKCGGYAYRALLMIMMALSFLIWTGTIRNVQGEVFSQVLTPSLRLLLPLTISVLICVFLVLLYRALDRFNRRQLIAAAVVLFGVMAAAFVVIICSFRVVPATDALNVQDVALYLARTGKTPVDLSAPHGRYILRFQNNWFLVVLFRCYFELCLRLGIENMTLPLLLLAAAAVMAGAVFLYLTGVLLGGMRRGTKILALCVMNPVYYLLILWAYTTVFSIPFTAAGIYFSLRVFKAKNARSRYVFCVLTAAAAVIGYYVRATSAIPVIAAAVCAFLWGLRGRERMARVLKCALVCGVVGVVLFKTVGVVNERHIVSDPDEKFPVTYWLLLGSHNNGMHNKEDVRYTASFETEEEKFDATFEKTLENYKGYTFTGYVGFLYNKLLVMWSQGDGGDLLNKIRQDNKMTGLYSWLIGDCSDLFRTYGYAFHIAVFFLILLAIWDLLGRKEIDPAQFLFLLSFFGGILLYSFWEIKPSYSLPFLYLFLLIGEHGGEALARLGSKTRKGAGRKGIFAAAPGLICVLGICIFTCREITDSRMIRRDWSQNGKTESSMGNIASNKQEAELVQEIFLSKPFNRITLAGNADDVAVEAGDSALLTIQNGDGKTVFERTISAEELSGNGYPVIDTGRIVPDGREKFTICLTKNSQSGGKMYFRCRSNYAMDIYEGVLTVNGKRHRSDLFLQVYNEYEGPWCSAWAARIWTGALALAAVLLYLWMLADARAKKAAE